MSNNSPTGSVVINGNAVQNQTLTVDTSTVADADGLGAFSYQWYRDGSAVTGATAATYGLTASDVGKQITVGVSYVDGGGTTESLTSAPTPAVLLPNPVIAPLAAASDSGVLGDGITKVTTPTLTGTGTVGTSVNLYDGTTLLGTVTVGATGSWSFKTPVLAPGLHALGVQASNATGGLSSTVPFPLTIDTSTPKPTVAISGDSGPVAASGATNSQHLVISGIAEAGATVQLLDGTTSLGTTIASGGSYAFDLTGVAVGTHSFTAKATDVAGNVASALPIAVTVDITPPAAPQISGLAAGSDTGASATDGITSNKTPTLVGTAEAGATVRIFQDGTQVGSAVASSTGTWSYRTATLTQSGHSFTAQAADKAGNVSGSSNTLNVTVDATAPLKPSMTVTGGGTTVFASGTFTKATSVTVNGATEGNARVDLLDGTTVLKSVQADANGNYSFDVNLAEGVHSFTAKAYDVAGNNSTSTAVTITADRTPPPAPVVTGLAVASDTGVAGDGITNMKMPTLVGTAEAGATVYVYDQGVQLGSAIAATTGAWSFHVPANLSEGVHSITASAVDKGGNIGATSTAVQFTVDATAPVKPVVAFAAGTATLASGAFTSSTALTVSGSTEAGAAVTLMDGTTAAASGTADGSGHFSFSLSGLGTGAHSFTVKAADVAGNTASSAPATITVDVAPPDTPVITGLAAGSDTGVSATDSLTKLNAPTFVGTAEPASTVRVYSDGTLLGTATASTAGAWSFHVPATALLDDGAHTITAVATDKAGNTGGTSTALVITVDTTLPATAINGTIISGNADPSGSYAGDGSTILLSGLTEANSQVQVFDGTHLLQTTTSDANGNWMSVQPASALGNGTHSFTVKVTDAAGNLFTSDAKTYTVDLVAPTARITGVTSSSTSTLIKGTTEAFARVSVYEGGTQLNSQEASSTGAWSFSANRLTPGPHTLDIFTQDRAGNLAHSQLVTDSTATVNGVTIESTGGNATLVGSNYNDFLVGFGGGNWFDGGANGKPWTGGDVVQVYTSSPDAVQVTQLGSDATGDDLTAYRNGYRVKIVDQSKPGQPADYAKNIESVDVLQWVDTNGNGVQDWGTDTINFQRSVFTGLHTFGTPLNPTDPTHTQWGDLVANQYTLASAQGGFLDDSFVASRDLDAATQSLMNTWGRGVRVQLGAGNDTAVGSAYSDVFVMGTGTNYVDGGAHGGTLPPGATLGDTLEVDVADAATAAGVTATALSASSTGADLAAFQQGYTVKVTAGAEADYVKNVQFVNVNVWNDANGNGQPDGGELTQQNFFNIGLSVNEITPDPANPGKDLGGTPLANEWDFAYANGGVANDDFVAARDVSAATQALMATYGRGVSVDLGSGDDSAVGSIYGDYFNMGAGVNHVDGGDNIGLDPNGNIARDHLDVVVATADDAAAVAVTQLGTASTGADLAAFNQGYTFKVSAGAETDYLKNVENVGVTIWNDTNGDGQRQPSETTPGPYWEIAPFANGTPVSATDPTLTQWGTPLAQQWQLGNVSGTQFNDTFDAGTQMPAAAQSQMAQYGRGVSMNMGAGDDTVVGTQWGDYFNMGPGVNHVDGGANIGTDPSGNPATDHVDVVVADAAAASAVTVTQLTAASTGADLDAYNQGYAFKVSAGAETDYLKNVENVGVTIWNDANGNGQMDPSETAPGAFWNLGPSVNMFSGNLATQSQVGFVYGTSFDDTLSADGPYIPQALRDAMNQYHHGLAFDGGPGGDDTFVGSPYGDVFTPGGGTNYIDGGGELGVQPNGNPNRDVVNMYVSDAAAAQTVSVTELNGAMSGADLDAYNQGYRFKVMEGDGSGQTDYTKNVEVLNINIWNDANGNGQIDQGETTLWGSRELGTLVNNNVPSPTNQTPALGFLFGTNYADTLDGNAMIAQLGKTFDSSNPFGAFIFALGGNDTVTGTNGMDIVGVTDNGSHLIDGGTDAGYYSYTPGQPNIATDIYRVYHQVYSSTDPNKPANADIAPNPAATNGGVSAASFPFSDYRLVDLTKWSGYGTEGLAQLDGTAASQLTNRLVANGTAITAGEAADLGAQAATLGLTAAGGNGYTLAVLKYDSAHNLLGVDFLKNVETVQLQDWYDSNNNQIPNGGTETTAVQSYSVAPDWYTLSAADSHALDLTLGGTTVSFSGYATGSTFGETLDFSALPLLNGAGYRLTDVGGNDVLTGTAGNDIIAMGAGNDIYDGGAGTDYAALYWTKPTGTSLVNLGRTTDANGVSTISVVQRDASNNDTLLFTLQNDGTDSYWTFHTAGSAADALIRPQGQTSSPVGSDVLLNIEHLAVYQTGLNFGGATTALPDLDVQLVGVLT
jgi:hypothetical protein